MSILSMQSILCAVATLGVAGIFYTWRAYHDVLAVKQRTLRERVAYMLWIMAEL